MASGRFLKMTCHCPAFEMQSWVRVIFPRQGTQDYIVYMYWMNCICRGINTNVSDASPVFG